MPASEPRWLQVVGWSDVGKTTVLTAWVQRACADGQRVAAVKWSHHPVGSAAGTMAAQDAGKDAERLYDAGARPVFRVGPDGWVELGAGPARRDIGGAHGVPRSLLDRWGALEVDWLVAEGGRGLAAPKIVLAPEEPPDVAPPVVMWLGPRPPSPLLAEGWRAAWRSPGDASRLIWDRRLAVSAPLSRVLAALG